MAPQLFVAPHDAQVVDVRSTERLRSEARSGVASVLKLDDAASQTIRQHLETLLLQTAQARQEVGDVQPFPSRQFSAALQRELWRLSDRQWQQFTQALLPSHSETALPIAQASLQQLQRLKQQDPKAFAQGLQRINATRQRYQAGVARLLQTTTVGQRLPFLQEVLTLSPEAWQNLVQATPTVLERILSQGLPPGLPVEHVQAMLRMHLGQVVPPAVEPLAERLLLTVLQNQSNLVIDQTRTRTLAEQRASAVSEVIATVRQGDVIVRQGDRIGEREFALLDSFHLIQRSANWVGLSAYALLIAFGALGVLLTARRWRPTLRLKDFLLIGCLALSVSIGALTPWHLSTLPAVGLLAGSFYGTATATALVGVLTAVLPLGLPFEAGYELNSFVASGLAGFVGALRASKLRTREELALLGLTIGLTEGLSYFLLTLLSLPAGGYLAAWYPLLMAVAGQCLHGLFWSVIALGVSPYLEQLFDLVTPIRLAELSNPNRPLLRRLALEAPGTFQHTLFVASLAEAAARALGCNVELVRAGTLYHDIGKMHDPTCFIENQGNGPNRHEQIGDPWKSADLIKKHVSEGLAMARRCRLPKAVQAFIPEHQGTMLIAYFYHQAKQQAESDRQHPVTEVDFRYPGPKPQTKETAIVMLADSCEAALRSLKEATPEEALRMIKRIIRARWQDNQLEEAGLSRNELTRIAEVFVQVWQQFHHRRIAYPQPLPLATTPSP